MQRWPFIWRPYFGHPRGVRPFQTSNLTPHPVFVPRRLGHRLPTRAISLVHATARVDNNGSRSAHPEAPEEPGPLDTRPTFLPKGFRLRKIGFPSKKREEQLPHVKPATGLDSRKPKTPGWTWSSNKRTTGDQLHHLFGDKNEGGPAKHQFNKWKRKFRLVRKELDRARVSPEHQEVLRGRAIRRLRPLLRHDSPDAMSEEWRSLPVARRAELFPSIMISALVSSREKAHLVLQAIFADTKPLPPFYMIEDSLELLVEQEAWPDIPDKLRQSRIQSLFFTLDAVMCNSPAGYIRLKQATIFQLLNNISGQHIIDLYNGLIQIKHPLGENTLVQFASRFASMPSMKGTALEILEVIMQHGFDINNPVGASLCTSILTMSRPADNDAAADSDSNASTSHIADLARCLLGLGMQPNIIIFTALIQNLCEAGEMDKAWAVYHMIKEVEIEPDGQLFATLINGSKKNMDYGSMRQAVSAAIEHVVLEQGAWNNFLHMLFLETSSGVQGPSRPAFGLMARAYMRLFKAEPLEMLCGNAIEGALAGADHYATSSEMLPALSSIVELIPAQVYEGPITPDAVTLRIMLLGYVGAMQTPSEVISFWTRFRALLEEGHPVARALVGTDKVDTRVHDLVIKALCRFGAATIHAAFEVMNEMLRDNAQAQAQAPAPAAASRSTHPAPSIYTWSIMLDGLMRDGQVEAGEHLLRMMRQYGLEPSRVTWNTLVAGYARLQKVSRTVGALQRLQGAGFSPNSRTFKAFGRLHNKERAISLMERVIERRTDVEEAEEEEEGRGRGHAGPKWELNAGPRNDELRRQQAVPAMNRSQMAARFVRENIA